MIYFSFSSIEIKNVSSISLAWPHSLNPCSSRKRLVVPFPTKMNICHPYQQFMGCNQDPNLIANTNEKAQQGNQVQGQATHLVHLTPCEDNRTADRPKSRVKSLLPDWLNFLHGRPTLTWTIRWHKVDWQDPMAFWKMRMSGMRKMMMRCFFANQIPPPPGFVCRFAEEFCLLHQVTARISVKRRRPWEIWQFLGISRWHRNNGLIRAAGQFWKALWWKWNGLRWRRRIEIIR